MSTNIGIHASEDQEVLKATDQQLAFSSEFKHPKIYSSGKISGTSQTVSHPFGYPLRTAGYILNSGKYFVHYDNRPAATSNYQFENSNYGHIKVDNSNIYLTADSTNSLIYLTYVDYARPNPTSVNQSKGNIGFQFSEDTDIFDSDDYEYSMTSEYRFLNIIQEGDVTVTADAISSPPDEQKTNIVDVNHSLGYAAHVIIFDERSRNNLNYVPYATGLGPDYIISGTEVYVDSSKIRFRISRDAVSTVASISDTAKNFKYHYFLTNYRLPS